MVFASAFDINAEYLELSGPFQFPWQLCIAAKRRNRPCMSTTIRPFDIIACIASFVPIKCCDFGRTNLAALFTDNLNGNPVVGTFRTGYALVDFSDSIGIQYGETDTLIVFAGLVGIT